jgi:hypothetical protein
VAGDQSYLFDWKPGLEQAARSLVTQIVKCKSSILSSSHARVNAALTDLWLWGKIRP